MRRAGMVLLLLATACQDKAKGDYDRCVDLDKGYDVKGALAACSAAVLADPKSPSGEAAAKKLLDLQSVSQKIQAENADKAARDAVLKKDQPELLAVATATATAMAPAPAELAADAGPDEVVAWARGLFANGDNEGARKVLEPRVLGRKAKPTTDEINLMRDVCIAQKDMKCGMALIALGRRRH